MPAELNIIAWSGPPSFCFGFPINKRRNCKNEKEVISVCHEHGTKKKNLKRRPVCGRSENACDQVAIGLQAVPLLDIGERARFFRSLPLRARSSIWKRDCSQSKSRSVWVLHLIGWVGGANCFLNQSQSIVTYPKLSKVAQIPYNASIFSDFWKPSIRLQSNEPAQN